MAEYLASIFGTEKDKVNCKFYFKIGSCRHGDRCSRVHTKPAFSQTVLIQNLYVSPQHFAKSADGSPLVSKFNLTDEEMQEHFDNFYEDVYVECEDKYGGIEEMHVCDNIGDHLVGNVYIKFRREENAEAAVNDLNNRWFGGRPITAELSPVEYFQEACCLQYELGECTRREFCNFIHLKPISRELHKYLYSHRSRRHSLHSHSRYHDGTRRTRSSSTRHDHHRNNHRGNESSGGFGGGRGERRNHRY